ncbi:hypothetical protein KIPB_006705 [Kipferlia bialata]|uniref:Uncharacterized protein n=1 Tax=Kipferlia bialata TaxID=797122 RepID=A0A9K3CYX7_9EUKA|nr:hypothetical protein KIPB_006705 [Kipferlia bialata]|eukprot:g6705.t1
MVCELEHDSRFDRVGYTAAIDGDWVVMDSLNKDGRQNTVLNLYNRQNGDEWVLMKKLSPYSSYDFVSVAMDAGLLVLGWCQAGNMHGQADVYRLDGANGYVYETSLVPPQYKNDPSYRNGDGRWVAIAGNGSRVVTGSTDEGQVNVFECDESSGDRVWSHVQSISARYWNSDTKVAISHDGHTIAAGLPEDGDNRQGSVKIYSDVGKSGRFKLSQTLTGKFQDNHWGYYGDSIVFSDDDEGKLLAVGADFSEVQYIYQRDAATGQYSLVDYGRTYGDTGLGAWADISGSTLLSGMSTLQDDTGSDYTDGMVGVFDLTHLV